MRLVTYWVSCLDATVRFLSLQEWNNAAEQHPDDPIYANYYTVETQELPNV